MVGGVNTMLNFNKLGTPSVIPESHSNKISFSADGVYFAIAINSAPYMVIYKRSGDTLTRLANPTTIPTDIPHGCTFSPDGIYLVFGTIYYDNSSPYMYSGKLYIYKRSGDTFTLISSPTPDCGVSNAFFSPDGTYLILGLRNAPYMAIYKRNGDSFTKLSNPATTPTSTSSGGAFSPDGIYLVLGQESSPYVVIYKRSGDGFYNLSISVIPTVGIYSCEFSPNGLYLVLTSPSNPNINIYKRNGDVFTKLSDPNPQASYSYYYDACSFSADGNYFAITGSLGALIYSRNGDIFSKDCQVGSNLRSCMFTQDGGYLIVTRDSSPFIEFYKLGVQQLYNRINPHYYPTTTIGNSM